LTVNNTFINNFHTHICSTYGKIQKAKEGLDMRNFSWFSFLIFLIIVLVAPKLIIPLIMLSSLVIIWPFIALVGVILFFFLKNLNIKTQNSPPSDNFNNYRNYKYKQTPKDKPNSKQKHETITLSPDDYKVINNKKKSN